MGKISCVVYPELRSTQKLSHDGQNFLLWKLKIAFVLTDHQLPHLINPSPEDPAWNREDLAAMLLILQTLDETLFLEFAHNSSYPTPASVMGELLRRFNSLSKGYSVSKFRRYRDYRMASDTDISKHIFRMRAMAIELEFGAGVKVSDEVQAVFLLNSLSKDWEEDVEGLLRDLDGAKEDLSFFNFSRRLRALQDVKKFKRFRDGEKMKKGLTGPCYNCGKRGHYKSDCPDQGSSKQESSSTAVVFNVDAETVYEVFYLKLKSRGRLDPKGSNFLQWKGDISLVLGQHELEYVLEEPMPHGPADSTSEEEAHHIKKWRADDFTCRHLILGAMEDDVFLNFYAYPTAKALMDALEAFFNTTSIAQKLVRLKKYMNHRMAEDTPIMNHLTKMDQMVWKLKKSGLDIPSEMQSVFLMDSLPGSWHQTVTSLSVNLNLDEENGWSIDNVWKRVRDAGHMKELMAQDHDSRFHDNANRKNLRGKCYSCGRSGHYQSDCPY